MLGYSSIGIIKYLTNFGKARQSLRTGNFLFCFILFFIFSLGQFLHYRRHRRIKVEAGSPGQMRIYQHFPKMTLDIANSQDNVAPFQMVVKFFQHFDGVDIHVHDGLSINQEEVDRRVGGLHDFLNPAGKISRIKKEERSREPVDQ